VKLTGEKILGVDYGEKRLGIALGVNGIIETLPEIQVLPKEKDSERLLTEKIKNICRQEEVGLILLGLSEGRTAERTRKFAKRLRKIVKLPVRLVDETLTTWESKKIAREIGKTKRFKRDHFDSIAAALLLKNFFEKEGVNV
jgi:putative Holliday junction resolvase